MTFKHWLAQRRKQTAGVTQADIAGALGKTRTYTAGLESGAIKPPGRMDCEKLAELFGLTPDDVWEVSAPDRLRAYDEDLWTWHLTKVAGRGDAGAVRLIQETAERAAAAETRAFEAERRADRAERRLQAIIEAIKHAEGVL